MSEQPYRGEMNGAVVQYTEPRDEDRRPLSNTFDRLIESNLQLVSVVHRLVRSTHLVLIVNAIFVALFVAMIWRK